MSAHRQTNEVNKSNNLTRKRRQPIVQALVSTPPTIHPNVLRRAIENPRGARPETILQLQRMYGNKAVSRVLSIKAPSQTIQMYTETDVENEKRRIDKNNLSPNKTIDDEAPIRARAREIWQTRGGDDKQNYEEAEKDLWLAREAESLVRSGTRIVDLTKWKEMHVGLSRERFEQVLRIVNADYNVAERAQIANALFAEADSEFKRIMLETARTESGSLASGGTTTRGSLTPQLADGLQLAQATPNAAPNPLPNWVDTQIKRDMNYDQQIIDKRNEFRAAATGQWNNIPQQGRQNIIAGIGRDQWEDNFITRRLSAFQNGLDLQVNAARGEFKWNEEYANRDGLLPGLIGAGGYKEYYAEAAPGATGKWGRNRVLHKTSDDGGHTGSWWVTADHYTTFKRVTDA